MQICLRPNFLLVINDEGTLLDIWKAMFVVFKHAFHCSYNRFKTFFKRSDTSLPSEHHEAPLESLCSTFCRVFIIFNPHFGILKSRYGLTKNEDYCNRIIKNRIIKILNKKAYTLDKNL